MARTVNILGITLARGGSKTVPRKNIRPLNGKPLLAYTIEVALKSQMLTNYVVSSDDAEILRIAIAHGASTTSRPSYLAEDNTPHLPALLHALYAAEERWDVRYDIVADIRCTNPLKNVGDIDGAIKTLIATGAECVAGVSPGPYLERLKRIVYDDHDIPRLVDVETEPESGQRQDLVAATFIRNGSIYVATVEHLRSGKYFVGVPVVPWIMPKMRSINIDDWVDFWAAGAVLENMDG